MKERWEPPLKVFLSYSSADSAEREVLVGQFEALRIDGLVELWHDRKLPLGKWEPVLDDRLRKADLFVCLVSRSFLSSNYCPEKEFVIAHERCDMGECVIVPIALKPVSWPKILKQFTALPAGPEKTHRR